MNETGAPGTLRGWRLSIAVGVLGAAVAGVAVGRYGPGLTTDSAAYLSAADSVRRLAPMIGPAGAPFTLFPPLFPLVLGIFGWFGIGGRIAAQLLNGACFALTIALVGTITARLTRSRLIGAGAALLTLTSAPLLDAATHVWTEPLFVTLLLLLTWSFGEALARDDRRYLLVSAVLAAALPMTRYVGVVVIPVAMLLVAGLGTGRLRRRLRDALAFGVVSSLPLALYLIRNLMLAGVLAGERFPSERSLVSVARSFVASCLNLFLPWSWIERLQPLSDTPWALALLFGATLAAVSAAGWLLLSWARANAADRWSHAAVAVLALFAGTHSLLLVYSSWSVAFEPINVRYLVSTFPALIILGALATTTAVSGGARRGILEPWLVPLKRTMIAAFIVLLALQAVRAGVLVREKMSRGAGGYATSVWVESPFVAYLRGAPPPDPAITNGPDVVFLFTGRRVPWVPRADDPAQLEDLRARIERGETVHLVWFDALEWRTYLARRALVLAAGAADAVHTESDGAVYRLAANQGASR